ncbi:MAG TPA: hypothetical protein VME66_07725 [Candidatus Acidoferrales bacterium]|nr:hypothetical protein [Candidatus Acidoferrales bacterium]
MTYVQSAAAQVKDAYGTVWRHRLLVLAVFCVLMVCSLVLIDKMPRTYHSSANVLIVNGNSRNDPTLASPDLPSIVTSTEVLQRVREDLNLSVPLEELKHNVSAKSPAYKSGIMRIDYADSSPVQAAMIANGIADELARYYNELSTTRYDQDLSALDAELAKQKARIQNLDAELQARGAARSMPSGDGTTTGDFANQLNLLQTQRALANADLQGDIANAQAAALSAQTRTEIARRDILQNDPLYLALQASATKESANLADVHAQFTSRYPGLPALNAKVASLQAAVAREEHRALSSPHAFSPTLMASVLDEQKAAAVVVADRAKVAALDAEVDRQQRLLDSQLPLQLLSLERDSATAEYQSLAARRATSLADRADALSLGAVVVVDRAMPSEATTTVGPVRLSAIFALICLLLALGSAFLADQLNPVLRRAAHIENLYGKPVIATLGKNR